MKKRIIAGVVLLIMLLAGTTLAEEFTIRNGIKWGMSREAIKQCLESEPDYSNYTVDYDYDRETYNSKYPQEATNPQLWQVLVYKLSLGRTNELAGMYLHGTKKDGLYEIRYTILVKDGEDETYARIKDLKEQLDTKYGPLYFEDNWEKRAEIEDGGLVYDSGKYLPDRTSVDLYVRKTNGVYGIFILYQSPDYDEIYKSILDGSIYNEPAFGL